MFHKIMVFVGFIADIKCTETKEFHALFKLQYTWLIS